MQKQLEEMDFNINHTYDQKNGYTTQQLFIWENVPKGNSDTENLRMFLKLNLGLDWLDKAHIEKTDGQSCIDVFYEMNHISIIMDKQARKATLSFKGKKQHEFIVKELPDGHFTVSYLQKFLEEIYLEIIIPKINPV